jgi:hypothetical protein
VKKINLNLIRRIFVTALFVAATFSPLAGFAAFSSSCGVGTVPDPRGSGLCLPPEAIQGAPRSFNDVMLRLINFGLSIAAVVGIAFVVYGGFLYMTAGMNEKNAEKGKKTIQNALIGLAFIILSYVIVGTVTNSLSDFRNSWRLF